MKNQIKKLLNDIENSSNNDNISLKKTLQEIESVCKESNIGRDLLYTIDYIYDSDEPYQRAETLINNISSFFDQDETKLEDHQHHYIGKIYTTISIEFNRINKMFTSDNIYIKRQEEIFTKIEIMGEELAKQKDTLEKQKNTLEKQYKDYIAILGIFAAIFMAFDSGLKIELEILNQVNDYAKGVLIIFIALFTYILLKSFYKFITNVYTDKALEETTKISPKQGMLYFILIVLAGFYCYLVHRIDEQYEQKIKPIVKEEISKLQQKEEKGNIIIYNNTSSTQNQDSTIIPKNEHTQQPMKIKANPPKQNTKKQSDNTKQACPPCQN